MQGSSTLRDFADNVCWRNRHATFPVVAGDYALGVISVSALAAVLADAWSTTRVEDVTDRTVAAIHSDGDVAEALRLLVREGGQPMLLVTSAEGKLEGIVTKTEICPALKLHSPHPSKRAYQPA